MKNIIPKNKQSHIVINKRKNQNNSPRTGKQFHVNLASEDVITILEHDLNTYNENPPYKYSRIIFNTIIISENKSDSTKAINKKYWENLFRQPLKHHSK